MLCEFIIFKDVDTRSKENENKSFETERLTELIFFEKFWSQENQVLTLFLGKLGLFTCLETSEKLKYVFCWKGNPTKINVFLWVFWLIEFRIFGKQKQIG